MLPDVEEIHADSLGFSPFYSLWGKCNGKLNLCSVLFRFLRSGESGAWQREVGSSPRAFAFKDDFSNAFPWTFSNLPFMVADDTRSQREGT